MNATSAFPVPARKGGESLEPARSGTPRGAHEKPEASFEELCGDVRCSHGEEPKVAGGIPTAPTPTADDTAAEPTASAVPLAEETIEVAPPGAPAPAARAFALVVPRPADAVVVAGPPSEESAPTARIQTPTTPFPSPEARPAPAPTPARAGVPAAGTPAATVPDAPADAPVPEAGEASAPNIAVARQITPPVVREKSAAKTPGGDGEGGSEKAKNFLQTEGQRLVVSSNERGTSVALPEETMRFTSDTQPRTISRPSVRAGLEGAVGASDEQTFSWKGWTNGGGERSSTAAQFSRLGESSPVVGVTAPAASAVPSRIVANPAAGQASVFRAPVDPASVTEPIGAAIERLVVRGQDSLAVTVRFEGGGSLSLKLALREGEVSTNIHTDVPGLEGALRSAWGQFAQDWQGRGVKLGQPSFSGAGPSQDETPQSGGRHAGRERPDGFDVAHESRLRETGDPARRGPSSSSATTTSRVATAERGLETWA